MEPGRPESSPESRMMSERQIRIWHQFRTVLSVGMFVLIAGTPVWITASYLGNGTFAGSLVNCGLVHWLAGRYGITYTIESPRLRSHEGISNFQFAAERVDLHLETADPLHLKLDRFSVTREGPLSVDGLEAGTRSQPKLLAAGSIDARGGEVKIRGIRFGDPGSALSANISAIELTTEELSLRVRELQIPSAPETGGPSVSLAEISTSPLISSDELLRLEEISLSGLDVQIPPGDSSVPLCEQIQEQLSTESDIALPFRSLIEAIPGWIEQLRTDLRWFLWIVIGSLFVLKLIASVWIYWERNSAPLRRAGEHLLLGLAAVLPPVVIFVSASWLLSTLWLIGLAAGASLATAIVLRRRIYRHADFRYQRWEPFAVDATAFLIVPVLALQGLDLGPPGDLPSAVRVDRIEIADTSIVAGAERCDEAYQVQLTSPRTRVSGIDASLAESPGPALSLAISDIEIPNSSLSLSSVSGNDSRELGSVSSDAALHDIQAQADLENRRIRDFRADIGISGEAASGFLREQFRRVTFLEQRAEQLARTTFDMEFELRGPAEEPVTAPDLPEPESSPAQLHLRGTLSLDLEECTVQYAANSRFRGGQLNVVLRADGDNETARIRSIQSQDGSTVKIAAGSGGLSLGEQIASHLQLRGLEAPLGSSRMSVDSAKLDTAFPVSCAPSGEQRFDAVVDGISINTTDDNESYLTKIASAIIRFQRDLDTPSGDTSLDTRLENIAVTGLRTGPEAGDEPKPWLDADLPAAQFVLEGRTSTGTLPREFDGTLSASLKRSTPAQPSPPDDIILGMDPPLRLNADFRQREINIPEQRLVLRQSLNEQLPAELPIELSLNGEFGKRLDSRVLIRELALGAERVQAELNGIEIAAEVLWVNEEPQPEVNFHSDWSRIQSADFLPGSFQLDTVESLELSSRGSVQRGTLDLDTLGLDQLPPLCTDGNSPQLDRFRIKGEWPANPTVPFLSILGETGPQIAISLPDANDPDLRIQGPSGSGIRIGQTERVIERLSLPVARLEALAAQLNVSGIRTLDRAGNLNAQTSVARSSDTTQLTTFLQEADGATLLGLQLNPSDEGMEFAATEDILLEKLKPALDPFLGHIGCDLSWITTTARIEQLEGSVKFAEEGLSSLGTKLKVAPGPLLSLDLEKALGAASDSDPAFLREVRFEIDTEDPSKSAKFRLLANLNSATTINADVSELRIEAWDQSGLRRHAEVNLSLGAKAPLRPGEAPANPIAGEIRTIARNLRSQMQNAQRIFGESDSSEQNDSFDLDWNLDLTNAKSRPIFEIWRKGEGREEDQLRLALAADISGLSWKPSDQETFSRLALKGEFLAAAKPHQDYLVVEGHAAAPVELSLAGEPERTADLRLPVAIAFRDELERSQPGTHDLWDQAHYENFWSSYRPTYPEFTTASGIDRDQLIVGPLSLRQIAFPVQPLRLAIGHSKRLHLSFPVLAHVLFGRAEGALQTDVQWLDEHAAVSVSSGLSLSNFQAGALGLASRGQHLPYVEDQLSGIVNFRARDFPLHTNTMRELMIDPSRVDGFDGLDMRLKFHRSEPNEALPGVVQTTTDMELKTMNDFLNRFIAKIRLSSPPQSVFYRGLDFDFQVANGEILTEPLLLELRRVRIASTERVDVEGNIRVHWKREEREGPRYWLRNFIPLFSGILPAAEND